MENPLFKNVFGHNFCFCQPIFKIFCCNLVLNIPGAVGTLTFAYYRGSDYLFGFKILNFAIYFGCRGFVNYFYGYANLCRYFFGVFNFQQVFFGGVTLKIFIFFGVSCIHIKYINLLVYA